MKKKKIGANSFSEILVNFSLVW